MRTTIDRRRFIAAGASLMIGSAARSALPVIRQSPKARIIIDN
ncbi:MAG: nucleoside hydrolase, partial [Sphingobium sp.]